MNKTQELKNKFKIFELVKKHFSLTDESLKLFKYRLFYERLIPKEFEYMKKYTDLRKRVKVEESKYENFDQGWNIFKRHFPSFVSIYKIKYNDFRRNKIKIEKQDMKFKKALEFYYLNHKKEAINDYIIYEDATSKERNQIIKNSILVTLEQVGTRKIPNCGLELVFSLNFADWFLCSSGEKWTSCISLDSNYENALWTGLPALIGDKNRGLVYLTDGSKKNYNGIEVDKIYSRTWVTLERILEGQYKNKTFLRFVRDYPIDIGLEKISVKTFDIPIATCKVKTQKITGDYRGRYYIELFWHKVNKGELLNSIYFDNFSIEIAKKNKAKLFKPGTFGYYSNGNGFSCFIKKNNTIKITENKFSYEGGLNRLIHKKVWETDEKKHILKEISFFYEGKENHNYYFNETDGFEDVEEDYE